MEYMNEKRDRGSSAVEIGEPDRPLDVLYSTRLKEEPRSEDVSVRPVLTIAIPTYNRCEYLQKLLSVLHEQIACEPRVELVISDNASTDETETIISDFVGRGLKLRYIRNTTNIGPDANILQCFQLAVSKYVWVFGDDDVIRPGGVRRVLDFLGNSEREYDLTYIVPYGYHDDYVRERKRRIRQRPPREISDPLQFVRYANRHGDLIFISAVIINKDRVDSASHLAFEQFIGTNLIQLAWVFTLLRSFRSGLFLDEQLIAAKIGSSGGFDAIRVFGINYGQIVNTCLGQGTRLSNLLLNELLELWFSWNWVSIRKSDVHVSASDPDKRLRPIFGSNPRYWIFVYPLLKAPLPLATAWCKIVCFPKRLKRVLGRYLSAVVAAR